MNNELIQQEVFHLNENAFCAQISNCDYQAKSSIGEKRKSASNRLQRWEMDW